MGQSASALDSVPPRRSSDLSEYPTDASTPFWTANGTEQATIRFADTGIASNEESPRMTVLQLFEQAVSRPDKADRVIFRQEPPSLVKLDQDRKWPKPLPEEQWRTWTLKDYYRDVDRVARALIAAGHEPHDAVNIWGFNSPEWVIGEMGTIFAGGKAAGIYPTDTPAQVLFKVRQSGSRAILVEDKRKLNVILSVIDDAPKVTIVVVWGGQPDEPVYTRPDGSEVMIRTWDQFLETSAMVDDDTISRRQMGIEAGHCCALIYTSGTTGSPKAVMCSHDNIVFEAKCIFNRQMRLAGGVGSAPEEERMLSYLPLSHVAGMMVDIISPLVIAAFDEGWVTTTFARPYDLSVGSLGDRLRAVRPTIFLGVPRVWEKIQDKLMAVGSKSKGLRKVIAGWAKRRGLRHAQACQYGGTGRIPTGYGFARKMVFTKVRAALGLDAMKFGFTGAAPIQVQTLEYFGSLGININEVYGMSECSGACTWSTDACHLWGSCGFALPGQEVKVFRIAEDGTKTECPRAEDPMHPTEEQQGELCYRGRNIMMGYMANPDLGQEHVDEIMKKNAAAIDEDGWLHSGDKGCQSTDGLFRITGRYKELIIGAGGENIAPVPIEDEIKRICQPISNFVMIGDKRKYNVALVTLKAKGATGVEPGGDELDGAAAAVDESITTIGQACAEGSAIVKAIEAAIIETNKNVSVVPNNASKIQKFTILPRDLSVNTDELTPTYKLKRGFVDGKFKSAIDAMYSGDRRSYIPFAGGDAAEPDVSAGGGVKKN